MEERDAPKFVMTYLFNDPLKGASFDFKALSADPFLQDDYMFLAVENPSKMLTSSLQELPQILGKVRRGTVGTQEGNLFFFFNVTTTPYINLRNSLVNLVPDKLKALIEDSADDVYKEKE